MFLYALHVLTLPSVVSNSYLVYLWHPDHISLLQKASLENFSLHPLTKGNKIQQSCLNTDQEDTITEQTFVNTFYDGKIRNYMLNTYVIFQDFIATIPI